MRSSDSDTEALESTTYLEAIDVVHENVELLSSHVEALEGGLEETVMISATLEGLGRPPNARTTVHARARIIPHFSFHVFRPSFSTFDLPLSIAHPRPRVQAGRIRDAILRRRRLVNDALREEVAADGPVHALSIVATTPERWREKMMERGGEDAVGPSPRCLGGDGSLPKRN